MKHKLVLATVATAAMLTGGAATAFAATGPANGAQTISLGVGASAEVTPVTIVAKHGRATFERARGKRGMPVVERTSGARVKPTVVRLRDVQAARARRGPAVFVSLRGKQVIVSHTMPSK